MYKNKETIKEGRRLERQEDKLDLPERRSTWRELLTNHFGFNKENYLDIPQIEKAGSKSRWDLEKILNGDEDVFLLLKKVLMKMEENRPSSLQSTQCVHGMEGYYENILLLVAGISDCMLKEKWRKLERKFKEQFNN